MSVDKTQPVNFEVLEIAPGDKKGFVKISARFFKVISDSSSAILYASPVSPHSKTVNNPETESATYWKL